MLDVLASPAALMAGGLGVLQIADLVDRDKGTVSRTLATLAGSGLVSRDPITHKYRLGYQLYALAARTLESHLVRVSRPYLRRLQMTTRETTHLCVLRSGNVLTLASEMSEYAVRGRGWEGMTTAAWQTPSGRVLLSDWSDDVLSRWYEVHGHDVAVMGPTTPAPLDSWPAGTPPLTDGKPLVTDIESLKMEIRRIRRQGYATIDGEFENGVVGVSAPIFDTQQEIIAAINVSAPKPRLGAHLDEVGTITARIAAELTAELCAIQRGA